MDVRKLTDSHLFVYFLLGQSCYNPRVYPPKPSQRKNKALDFLPVGLLSMLAFTIAALAFSYHYQSFHLQNHSQFISLFWIMIQAATIGVGIASSIYNCRRLPSIIEDLQSTERLLKCKLQTDVNLKQFSKIYRSKVTIMVVSVAICWLGKWVFKSKKSDFLMETFSVALLLIATLSVSHTLLFIGILRQFLELFSDHININSKLSVIDFACWSPKVMITKI